MSIDFEETIVNAIASQFFAPVAFPGTAPDGTPTVMWSTSPAQGVTQTLFKNNEKLIFEKIAEKLDLDALAEQIATKLMVKLTSPPSGWSSYNEPSVKLREQIDKATIEKVAQMRAEEFTKAMGTMSVTVERKDILGGSH